MRLAQVLLYAATCIVLGSVAVAALRGFGFFDWFGSFRVPVAILAWLAWPVAFVGLLVTIVGHGAHEEFRRLNAWLRDAP